MKKIMRKLKRANVLARYSYYLLLIAYLVGFGLFVKNILALAGIETLIRIVLMAIFIGWFIFYGFYNLLNLITKKYKPFIFSSLITILFIGVLFLCH